jgi:hypothetical protein
MASTSTRVIHFDEGDVSEVAKIMEFEFFIAARMIAAVSAVTRLLSSSGCSTQSTKTRSSPSSSRIRFTPRTKAASLKLCDRKMS